MKEEGKRQKAKVVGVSRALLPFALFLLPFLALARGQWAEALYRLIIEGSYAALWLLAAAGLGAGMLRATKIQVESKALAFATSAAIGFGLIGFAVLGLGLVGWLNRPVAMGIVLAGLAVGAACVKRVRFDLPESLPIFMPTLAIALIGAFTLPGVLWPDEPAGYDAMEYHLQVPREWYEAGRIVPLKHNVFSYFPFNVEMHYLLAMHLRGGVYEGMYLAQMMHVVLVGLSVIAVAGTGWLAAVVMAGVPWVMLLAPVAYNEGGLLLFGTLSIIWAIQKNTSPPKLALAGVMAGLACGSKLTAVPMLLLGVPLAGIVARRLSLQSCGLFIAAGVFALSPWLIRNQFWAGNPIFPEAASVFGRGHFTDAQLERWADAHHPVVSVTDRLSATWRQLLVDWRWGLIVIPLSLLAAVLIWQSGQTRFLAILLLLQFAIWFGFTHLQGRFFILAVPILAMLITQIDTQLWRSGALAAAGLSTLLGWFMLSGLLLRLPASLGIDDFKAVITIPSILPAEIAAQVFEEKHAVTLVGEAEAFMFPLPMSRLRYRSVFDIVDWIDPSTPSDALIVVNPAEVKRLARTYTHLPPLPPGLDEHDQPFILPR